MATASTLFDAFLPPKALSGFASRRIESRDGIAVGLLDQLELRSIYQPVLSPMLMRIVGVEASLDIRRHQGPVDAHSAFAHCTAADRADINRMAFMLHTINAPAAVQGNEWIFLPVHPQVFLRMSSAAETALGWLQELRMDAARIVLDLGDIDELDDAELKAGIAAARAAGFSIAMPSGDGDRVLALRPDIVRLGSNLIRSAEHSPWDRRLFPHIISQLQAAGSLVLVDGISSEAQAHIAIDANAELLQGDWLAPRARQLPDSAAMDAKARKLVGSEHARVERSTDTRLRGCFMTLWNAYHSGRELEDIVSEVAEPQVTRAYIIDNNGFQMGATVLTPHALQGRQHPLANATGACWARRHYFRNAVAQPGRVQMTRPYLSLTEQRLCVTYSCVVMRKGLPQVVLCMDALVEGEQA
jgi:EAL domain-containing protein (putative c-di-GMP-specific phosphodiesterase class I)